MNNLNNEHWIKHYYLLFKNDINSNQDYQLILISPNNSLIQPDFYYTYTKNSNIISNEKNNYAYSPKKENKEISLVGFFRINPEVLQLLGKIIT